MHFSTSPFKKEVKTYNTFLKCNALESILQTSSTNIRAETKERTTSLHPCFSSENMVEEKHKMVHQDAYILLELITKLETEAF